MKSYQDGVEAARLVGVPQGASEGTFLTNKKGRLSAAPFTSATQRSLGGKNRDDLVRVGCWLKFAKADGALEFSRNTGNQRAAQFLISLNRLLSDPVS